MSVVSHMRCFFQQANQARNKIQPDCLEARTSITHSCFLQHISTHTHTHTNSHTLALVFPPTQFHTRTHTHTHSIWFRDLSRPLVNRCRYDNYLEYDGEFENGVIHGDGVMKFTDGATYTGTFSNGVRHGKGNMPHASCVSVLCLYVYVCSCVCLVLHDLL